VREDVNASATFTRTHRCYVVLFVLAERDPVALRLPGASEVEGEHRRADRQHDLEAVEAAGAAARVAVEVYDARQPGGRAAAAKSHVHTHTRHGCTSG
jgi:hypothetical protein